MRYGSALVAHGMSCLVCDRVPQLVVDTNVALVGVINEGAPPPLDGVSILHHLMQPTTL